MMYQVMHIYKTTNRTNGRIYIGQEKKFNPNYFGSGTILFKAIQKHGVENFTKEIIEENISSKEYLDQREIFWIEKLNSRDKRVGYNVAKGGQGGDFLDEIALEKRGKRISKAKRGKPLSESHKVKIKDGIRKRFPVKYKISNSNYSHFGESNSFYGRKHSGDLSRFSTRKGIVPTNAIKIIDEDGNIFNSATEAAKNFPNSDTARRAIVDVCREKRLHFKGKIFRFLE